MMWCSDSTTHFRLVGVSLFNVAVLLCPRETPERLEEGDQRDERRETREMRGGRPAGMRGGIPERDERERCLVFERRRDRTEGAL